MRIGRRLKRDTVIFDIDGVLCDNYDRQMEYVRNGGPVGKLWDDFLAGVPDAPSLGWVTLARMLYPNHCIVLLTARPEHRRSFTVDWMITNGVPYDVLLMYPTERSRDEFYSFKQDELRRLLTTHNVVLAIDDDEEHVRMYQRHAVPVLHVPPPIREEK